MLFILGISVLAVLHVFATTFFLYWTYPWFDIPMHGLGGVLVAFGFLMCMSSYARRDFTEGLLVTVVVVFSVGVAWELFELAGGITIFGALGYVGDTARDLLMDVVGGAFGYVCARAIVSHEKTRSG